MIKLAVIQWIASHYMTGMTAQAIITVMASLASLTCCYVQTWGNCNSNCNVIEMNYIFKVMEGNL